MNHWLLKSEPTAYSIDDLKADKVTDWTGIRNYQARNFIREMKKGDLAFIYHSSCDAIGIAGIAKIASDPHADATAFDKKDEHFDPKSKKENPTWLSVDIGFVKKFKEIISLDALKRDRKLNGMVLLQRGSRLSIQPVSKEHFEHIQALKKARISDDAG